MTSKFAQILLATALVFSMAALAQTNAAAASPAPASRAAAVPSAPSVTGTGTKLGTINIEQAIFATNEGRRDFETLSKKLEPKQTELKGMNDELESLQKQLNTQSDKLNDEARANLVKQIEQKKKTFERVRQDAQEEAQGQQNEIAQRILQKMAPVLVKYAGDNGFGIIIDTSQPWPQGPVVWQSQAVDVTKPIVDAYNAQSGVAAPTSSGAARPAGTGTRPAGTTTKPATPPPSKPQTTSPPK